MHTWLLCTDAVVEEPGRAVSQHHWSPASGGQAARPLVVKEVHKTTTPALDCIIM